MCALRFFSGFAAFVTVDSGIIASSIPTEQGELHSAQAHHGAHEHRNFSIILSDFHEAITKLPKLKKAGI
jgi:hypothetical protein